MFSKRSFALPVAALTGALFLSACGSTATSSSTTSSNASTTSTTSASSAPAGAASTASSTAFNTADVTFATMMIPHHAQAVEMAKLAASRASSGEVKSLASKIEAAQQPEIDLMSGWLTSWGKPVPDTSMAGMSGMGSGSSDGMGGMMTDAQMSGLESAKGPDFDRLFLTLMIKHHEGAIQMAQIQVKDGKNTDAITLAKKIVEDQKAEISTMQGLLAQK